MSMKYQVLKRLERIFEALRKAIDDDTTLVAGRIDKLTSGIKNSMTDEEVADLKAGFQAEADRLKVLGTDPANPIPPTP